MNIHRFTTAEAAMSFLQAGCATITIVSVPTGNRFTYKVSESNDGKVFFVGVLSGPDNEFSYTYLGIIREGVFQRTQKSRIATDAPSHVAFQWLYQQLAAGRLPSVVEIWHEGTCGRCGRKLTVPASIESGIGPECAKIAAKARPQLAMAV